MAIPTDSKLYQATKKAVIYNDPVHSAIRSARIVRMYKKAFARKYGLRKSPYRGTKPTRTGLTKWFRNGPFA